MKHRRRRLSKREIRARRRRAAEEMRAAALTGLMGKKSKPTKRRVNLERGKEFMVVAQVPVRPLRSKQRKTTRREFRRAAQTAFQGGGSMGRRRQGF